MEAASCSTLNSLRLSPSIQNNLNPKSRNIVRNLQLGRSFSSNFPKEPFCFGGIHHLPNGFWAASSDSASGSQNPSPELAVLLEVDGVLMDAYRSGNREKNSFVKSVLREKKNALDEFAASTSSSLRPGVENFIGDALDEDIPVVILTTYGKSEEKIASLQKIVAALRAGAEYAGVPVSNCVLVAGTQTGLAAAVQIAMPCIILRSSLTARRSSPRRRPWWMGSEART